MLSQSQINGDLKLDQMQIQHQHSPKSLRSSRHQGNRKLINHPKCQCIQQTITNYQYKLRWRG